MSARSTRLGAQGALRTISLTVIAMIAFAGNSLRGALSLSLRRRAAPPVLAAALTIGGTWLVLTQRAQTA